MIKKVAMLLAPGNEGGGGAEAEVAEPGRPDSLGGWMDAIASDEPEVRPEPEPEKEKPKAAPKPKEEPEAEEEPKKEPAKAASAAPTKVDPKAKAPEPEKKKEPEADKDADKPQTIEEVRAELNAESWPRQATDWENKKKKYGAKLDKISEGLTTRDNAIKDLQGKLQELETKATEAGEPNPEITSKIERLEAKNKLLTEKIMELNVREHPDFKKWSDEQYQPIYDEAKAIVGEEHAEKIEKILKITDRDYRRERLEEFMASMQDDNARFDLRGVVRDLVKADAQYDKEIKKAEEFKTQAVGKQADAVKTLRTTYETAFSKVLKQLQDPKNGMPIFQKRDGEGAESWNKGVEARVEAAKDMLLGKNFKNPEQVVRTAFDAASLRAVLEGYRADHEAWAAEKAKLEAQIAEMTAAQPGGKGAGPTDAGEGGGGKRFEVKAGDNPHEVSRKWAESIANGE